MKPKLTHSKVWLPVLCWLVFAAGLLVQLLAPGLKKDDGKFIIPPAYTEAGSELDPATLVRRERGIQLLSAMLTVAGAVGLACVHRKYLLGRSSANATHPERDQAGIATAK